MSFLNTQLIKKYDVIKLRIRKKIIKYVIFKYAINEKTCYHDCFYDITNLQ